MELKRILLVLDSGQDNTSALKAALRVAHAHGATVEAVCLYPDLEMSDAGAFARAGAGIGDLLERRAADVRALTAAPERAFRRTFDRAAADAWRIGEADSSCDVIGSWGRLADLAVMTAAGEGSAFRRCVEHLLLESGTPCLAIPAAAEAPNEFRRVLLAWNNSREAKRAMSDALDFLKAATEVRVLEVPEPSKRPIDSREVEALLHYLASHGVRADAQRPRDADVTAAAGIAEQCESFGADLLVMGAYGHTRAAEALLGGATRTLLARVRRPTLLSH